MPPRKKPAATASSSGEASSRPRSPSTNKRLAAREHPILESNLPKMLQFPLVVIISLSIAAVANTIAAEFTQPALGRFSYETWSSENWRVAVVLAWKTLELGIAWFSGYDDVDMLSLTVLTHLPHAYLLKTFYLIDTFPIAVHLTITCIANIVPFFLLRRRSAAHVPNPVFSPDEITNDEPKDYTHDVPIWLAVSALGSVLYMIILYASLITWLPTNLAITFNELETLEPAHLASLPRVLLATAPLGFFTHSFLFAPALRPSAATLYVSEAAADFDPITATLGETIHRNVFWWQYLPPRQQEVVRRGAVLVVWTLINVWFLAWGTVKEAEGLGALEWAGVWATGACLVGGVFEWVSEAA